MKQFRKAVEMVRRGSILPLMMLAACGIVLSLGYMLCPTSMQGGEMLTSMNQFGFLLVRLAGAVTDNAGILFAASIGYQKNRSLRGMLFGLTAWLMFSALCSPYFLLALMPELSECIQSAISYLPGIAAGILAGLLGCWLDHNYGWKGNFFRTLLTVMAGMAVVTLIYGIIWLFLFSVLTNMGIWLAENGSVGAMVYAVLNRLLMPVQLHHALNGAVLSGMNETGDLARYWAGSVTGDPGQFMSGFFAPMIFGIPAAVYVLIRNGKGNRENRLVRFLTLAALCSALSGFSEPFEYLIALIFPLLYLLHCILYGVSTLLCDLVHFRAGFALSGGLADFMFSAAKPASSNPLLLVPIGLIMAFLYYVLYCWYGLRHRRETEELVNLFEDQMKEGKTVETDGI